MEISVLRMVEEGVFCPEKLQVGVKLDKKIDFSKFILCSKACDGTYHRINSDISEILSENKTALANGGFQRVISKFFDEDIHGQRFLVYPNGQNAFLIGNLFFGLKKLSKL